VQSFLHRTLIRLILGHRWKINNFFCGLHLLVNFAECASPTLKEFDALCKDQGESDVIGELENEFQADERKHVCFVQ
jgi:hypothetical protein